MAFSVAGERLLHQATQAEARGDRSLAQTLRSEAEQVSLESVFGKGFKRDKNNRPIEQGIGSESNITAQHIDAIRKFEGEAAAAAIIARATKAGLWPPKHRE